MKNVERINIIMWYMGTILSTIGFGALLYGVSDASSKGWTNREIIAFLSISVITLLIFAFYSLKWSMKQCNK